VPKSSDNASSAPFSVFADLEATEIVSLSNFVADRAVTASLSDLRGAYSTTPRRGALWPEPPTADSPTDSPSPRNSA